LTVSFLCRILWEILLKCIIIRILISGL
jgi:hypothetical protein